MRGTLNRPSAQLRDANPSSEQPQQEQEQDAEGAQHAHQPQHGPSAQLPSHQGHGGGAPNDDWVDGAAGGSLAASGGCDDDKTAHSAGNLLEGDGDDDDFTAQPRSARQQRGPSASAGPGEGSGSASGVASRQLLVVPDLSAESLGRLQYNSLLRAQAKPAWKMSMRPEALLSAPHQALPRLPEQVGVGEGLRGMRVGDHLGSEIKLVHSKLCCTGGSRHRIHPTITPHRVHQPSFLIS